MKSMQHIKRYETRKGIKKREKINSKTSLARFNQSNLNKGRLSSIKSFKPSSLKL